MGWLVVLIWTRLFCERFNWLVEICYLADWDWAELMGQPDSAPCGLSSSSKLAQTYSHIGVSWWRAQEREKRESMQGHLSPRLGKARYFCLILSTKANQDQLIYKEWGNKFCILMGGVSKSHCKDHRYREGGVENWGHFAVILKLIVNRTLANLK